MENNTQITTIDQELIDAVKNNMPMENSFQRLLLPRLGMFSQDKTEGKGKAMKVVNEAGTFYIERETDEINDAGKKVWKKEEIGKSLEATVVFYRRQLSMYDNDTNKYTSSPIYDNDEEIIPLFCDRKEVEKGNAKELKAKYKFIDPKTGKTKSKLEDNKILYVLYQGELYQMTIKGTSMFSFMTYVRSITPPTVLTGFDSEAKKSGVTEWNMMNFKTLRTLNTEELTSVVSFQNQIKFAISSERAYFASINTDVETSVIDEDDWKADLPEVKAPEF